MYARESLGWDKTRSGQVRLVQFTLEVQGGCPLFIGAPGTGKILDLFFKAEMILLELKIAKNAVAVYKEL
jgi:hypothetical protein